MARPLIRYLRRGSYEGFDIVPAAIAWCTSSLAPLHPRFHFRHVDLFNSYYNPEGTVRARSFRFPYADGEFDFVYLTSVFTHMFAADSTNYISEVRRVLRPGGRMLATFFLLDGCSLKLIELGKVDVPFFQEWEHGRIGYPDQPELAVAYDLSWLESTLENTGLALRRPIRFGNWTERGNALSYQDIVIADNLR
jgi:SAM-dependent methyltransferase